MSHTFPSARAEMTLPSADKDLLMFFASSNTVPSAPVLLTYGITESRILWTTVGGQDSISFIIRYLDVEECVTFSLPAKSTKYSLPLSFFCVSTFSCFTWIRKILWLRELCSFMSAWRKTIIPNFKEKPCVHVIMSQCWSWYDRQT